MEYRLRWYYQSILISIFILARVVMHAQVLQPDPANDPATNWLTISEAQIQVQNNLATLQPQLQGLTPGTTPHTDLLRRIIFYKAILRELLSEAPVERAIGTALPEAASMAGLYEQAFTPEPTLRSLYDEAVALLKQ